MGANRNVAAAILLLTLAGVGQLAWCDDLLVEAAQSPDSAAQGRGTAFRADAAGAPEPVEPFAEALAKARKAIADADGEQQTLLARSVLKAILVHGGELAVRDNDLSAARQYYRETFALATKLSAPETQAIVTRMGQLQARFEQADRISTMRNSLAANPQDIDTRRRLIELLTAEAQDPTAASELLTNEIDEPMRRAVSTFARPITERSAEQCLTLADWLAKLDAGLTDTAKRRIALARLECLQRFVMVRRAGEGNLTSGVADIEALVAADQSDSADSAQRLPAGLWTDLLQAAPVRFVAGATQDWRVRNGLLAPSQRYPTVGMFPVDPDGSYRLFVRLRLVSDKAGLLCYLPSGGRHYALSLNVPAGQKRLDSLAGRRIGPTAITADIAHTIAVTVQRGQQLESISVELDGQPYAARLGASCRSIGNRPPAAGPAPRGIILRGNGPVEILSLLIKPDDAIVDPSTLSGPSWQVVRKLDVRANKSWQWVAQVSKGDILHITPTGTWSWNGRDECGPAGDASGWYALRGRLVKQDVTFPLGSSRTLVVTEDDILRMEMEDTDKSDNTGAVAVTIRQFRSAAKKPETPAQDPQADDQP
ncbi:MAG: hypothetical protein ACYS8X_14005 [Planctomycetota bacterium]|jgi:hypothetical protein